MSLILRNEKGSPLTHTEMDDNLVYLESLSSGTSSTPAASLLEVMNVGNETPEGVNIVMATSSKITSSSTGNNIRMDHNVNDILIQADTGVVTSSEHINLNANTGEFTILDLTSRMNNYTEVYETGTASREVHYDWDGNDVNFGSIKRIAKVTTSGSTPIVVATYSVPTDYVVMVKAIVFAKTKVAPLQTFTSDMYSSFMNDGGVLTQLNPPSNNSTSNDYRSIGIGAPFQNPSIFPSGTDIIIRVSYNSAPGTLCDWYVVYEISYMK